MSINIHSSDYLERISFKCKNVQSENLEEKKRKLKRWNSQPDHSLDMENRPMLTFNYGTQLIERMNKNWTPRSNPNTQTETELPSRIQWHVIDVK